MTTKVWERSRRGLCKMAGEAAASVGLSRPCPFLRAALGTLLSLWPQSLFVVFESQRWFSSKSGEQSTVTRSYKVSSAGILQASQAVQGLPMPRPAAGGQVPALEAWRCRCPWACLTLAPRPRRMDHS